MPSTPESKKPTPAIMAMVASVRFGAKQQSRPHCEQQDSRQYRLQSHFFFNAQ